MQSPQKNATGKAKKYTFSDAMNNEETNPLTESIIKKMGGLIGVQSSVVPKKMIVQKHQSVELSKSFEQNYVAKLAALLKKPLEFEIEASIGTYTGKTFSPGIKSYYIFNNLKKSLENYSHKFQKDVVFVVSGSPVRKIKDYDGHTTFEKKYRDFSNAVINKSYGIRITSSKEENMDDDYTDQMFEKDWDRAFEREKDFSKRVAIVRNRDRVSYSLGNFNLDLTDVTEHHISNNGEHTVKKYEIEIERAAAGVTVDEFVAIIKTVTDLINGGVVIDNKEKEITIRQHNKFVFPKIPQKNPMYISPGYWNKPKNIKLTSMITKEFNPWVTLKVDGMRFSIFITTNGVYMIAPPWTIIKLADGISSLDGTLLDCEYINNNEFLAFDILFHKGQDMRQKYLSDRYEALTKVLNSSQQLKNMNINPKKYLVEGSVFERVRKLMDGKTYKSDGLIFQPIHWYKNNNTYKWKPPNELTIDFFMKQNSADTYIPHVLDGKEKVPFRGSKNHPFDGVVKGENLGDKIIECMWTGVEFEYYREREDRSMPNNKVTAIDVWSDIMNPIPKRSIRGETLQIMRKYHNIEKKKILEKYLSNRQTIIDIGSGRGGDLAKWNSIGLKKIYAIEPNDENMMELLGRKTTYKNLDVTVLNTGAENTSAIKKAISNDEIDAIVSLFSLTFFPKNEKLYNELLDTISLIKPGGVFVGGVLDGQKVSNALQKDRRDSNLDDDDAAEIVPPLESFEIYQNSTFNSSAFGNSIMINMKDTMVIDQTEWLFYFDKFRNEMENRGFELVDDYFLDSGVIFDKLPKESQQFSSFNRMFAFRKKEYKEKKSVKVVKLNKDIDRGTYAKLQIQGMIKHNYQYTPAIFGESNMIHAFLTGILSSYTSFNRSRKLKETMIVRKQIMKHITDEEIEEMFEFRKYMSRNEKLYTKNIKSISLDEFRLDIIDNMYISSSFQHVLERIYDVKICIVDGNPAKFPLNFPKTKFVILYNLSDNYFTVGKRINDEFQTVF